MQFTSDDVGSQRAAAFKLLTEVVGQLRARGKRTLIQGIKPEMQRLSYGAFDERRLGFASFGDFVAAAEQHGIIRRDLTAHGVDVRLSSESALATQEPGANGVDQPLRQPPPPRTLTTASRRIRPDLWFAFVDFRPQLLRVWDREEQRAHMFPAEPVPLEAPDVTKLRQDVGSDNERFQEIESIGLERQLEWMRNFAIQHSKHPLATALLTALEADRPVQAFSRLLRLEPTLAERWRTQRVALVAEFIAAWAGGHGLAIDVWEDTRPKPSAPDHRAEQPALARSAPDVERLRALVHRAVEVMSHADLLRLAIPLEHVVGEHRES